MPLLRVRLFDVEDAPKLNTAVAAFLTAQSIVAGIRGQAMCAIPAGDNDVQVALAIAHGGLARPGLGSRIGNVSVVSVSASGLVAAQAAVDLALSDAVHQTITNGTADAFPGDISSATSLFEAEDVGRKIIIAGQTRTVTAFVSATRVTYSGAAISGTGLTVSLLGAEVIQPDGLQIAVYKKGSGDRPRFTVTMALGGETI